MSEDACGSSAHLPDGVCRVAAGALGATRLMECAPTTGSGRVLVAAFDFDGTCIRGNSPVLLVRHLARKRMLAPSVVARILGWAACYKARLPQNESWVRGLVFRAFAGRPVGEVNRFLYDFYDRFIDERFRADAEAAMRAHEVEGPEKVAVLSRFCDEQFGAGSWELGWAYGDHHSDRSLLAAARHACAVTPDRPLTRTANAEGYDILDW